MSELTYSQKGDYLLPDLALSESPMMPEEPIGKYGMMRRKYLKEHRPILYNSLLLSEKLFPHLRETEQTATNRIQAQMAMLLSKNPPPDKSTAQMQWVAHMNSLRSQAEEITINELIYS